MVWGPWLGVWAVSLSTTELISRRLSPQQDAGDIRSLPDVGTPLGAFGQTVLYLRQLQLRANPKVISGRASYHQA